MNKRSTFSPVLLELIVAILFFALSMSVIIRLIAAANDTSRDSMLTGRAMIAMESVMEEIKADPVGDGKFDMNEERRLLVQVDEDLILLAVIRCTSTKTGVLYDIDIQATSGEKKLGSLTSSRYISGRSGT